MKQPCYTIKGGYRLEGEVTISGAKNAAVAIIPAAIMAGECCILENLPHIQDVFSLKTILEEIGASVDFTEDGCMRIDPSGITDTDVTSDAVRAMRASYYLLGAMIGKYKEISLALPGGCVIGARPIDQHLKGIRALGAEIVLDEDTGTLHAKASRLKGTEIFFDVVSVGATINVMLAAVLAEGVTVLQNVAKEPHVVDVANFLNMMGANIRGAGTDVIRITGVKKLHGARYSVIPDQIETGTFMIAAAATCGDVIIRNVIPTHMEAVSAKLLESGAQVIEGDDGHDFFLRVSMNGNPRPVQIKTAVYPGFPTDLQQPMMTYLTVANGTSVITENIFENRLNHVKELRHMGASISIKDRTARVKGVPYLKGAELTATDLRAGASLIVAGLMGRGVSHVYHIEYIDRGYEYLDKKLSSLGACILREDH